MNSATLPVFARDDYRLQRKAGRGSERAPAEASPGVDFVQSNMTLESNAGMLDVESVRRQAEAARAAWIRGTLSALWLVFENWLERHRQRELEEYLEDSQNLAELEARMRRYTNKRVPFGLASPDYD